MYAINEAAKFLKLHPTQGNNIHIFTDSQNSLQKLNKPSTNSKLTLDTIENLNELSKSQNITLHKVRAHIGIEGNELADSLAKKGASTKQIGPEPFPGVAEPGGPGGPWPPQKFEWVGQGVFWPPQNFDHWPPRMGGLWSKSLPNCF